MSFKTYMATFSYLCFELITIISIHVPMKEYVNVCSISNPYHHLDQL